MLLIFVIIYVTNENNNTLIYPPSPKFIASHSHKNCTKTKQFQSLYFARFLLKCLCKPDQATSSERK